MNHPSAYRGETVVVLGLAKSGQAAARLLHDAGARVVASDRKPRGECPEADELEALGIEVICGGHPESLIHPGVKLMVKNPGIPYSAPPVARAAELGIEIVSEVELAYHVAPGPMIGITGSNGKTTTTTWIGRMLEAAGMAPLVAGNIGRPLCDAAQVNRPDQWLVAELSSFQLKGTRDFRPRIGCLLNISETHLDYHSSMEDYIASKLKLFANQQSGDIAVLNWDDPLCRRAAASIAARLVPFSSKERLGHGVWIEGGTILWRSPDGAPRPILAAEEIGLVGKHNLENALAAASVAIAAGAPIEAVAEQLRAFRGVEHRLEFVREIGGVRFYNDSKATNPAAAVKAMEAFSAPIVWIGGGLDRGLDFAELKPLFASKVKAAVLLGETRRKLAAAAEAAGLERVEIVDNADSAEAAVDAAVRRAYGAAAPGDVVLFSPACASWDMFTSFEERGRMFKAAAHNL